MGKGRHGVGHVLELVSKCHGKRLCVGLAAQDAAGDYLNLLFGAESRSSQDTGMGRPSRRVDTRIVGGQICIPLPG